MKIIIITVISLFISLFTIKNIRNNAKIAKENSNYLNNLQKVKKKIKEDSENLEAILYDNTEYQYKSITENLSTDDYIQINECMQLINNEFESTKNCEDNIVTILVNKMGERAFMKSILGYMYNYDKDLYQTKSIRGLFSNYLESKLALSFINRYRGAKKLQKVFDDNKEYFYNLIPKSLYHKSFESDLKQFSENYEYIQNQDDVNIFFEKLYEEDYPNWKYTFWYRRKLENLDKTIYDIIKEIQQHYQE